MKLKGGLISFKFLLFLFLIPSLAQAGVVVEGGLLRERIVEIGATYEGSILLRNVGAAPREVKIYQTDFISFADGRSIYGEPGSIPRSNATWISLSPRRIIIPPGRQLRFIILFLFRKSQLLKGAIGVW